MASKARQLAAAISAGGALVSGASTSVWTTATRPVSPPNGQIGYNNTTDELEGYINNGWVTIQDNPTKGQQVYSTPGTYSWVAPAGVSNISVVCVGGGGGGDDGTAGDGGGGGGGGGGLAYANNIPVVAGQSYAVVVGAGGSNGNGFGSRALSGGNSTFTVGTFVMTAEGGQGGAPYSTIPGSVGGAFSFANMPAGVTLSGGGSGGGGGAGYNGGGGGGGAGGYGSNGGNGSGVAGRDYTTNITSIGTGGGGGGGAAYPAGSAGAGGGGGGTGQPDVTGGGGGGAALFSSTNPTTAGAAGNGLTSAGSKGGNGGFPGGGGGGSFDGGLGLVAPGGNGAVRIIFGPNRQFPSNAVDV